VASALLATLACIIGASAVLWRNGRRPR